MAQDPTSQALQNVEEEDVEEEEQVPEQPASAPAEADTKAGFWVLLKTELVSVATATYDMFSIW